MEADDSGVVISMGLFNTKKTDMNFYCPGMYWPSMCSTDTFYYSVKCAYQTYQKVGWNLWKTQAQQCGCPVQS